MDVIFHIGVHLTNGDRLVKSLLKNLDIFSQYGVAVPGPSRYRRIFGEAVANLRGRRASDDAVDALYEVLLDGNVPDRLILSNDSFISMAARVIEDGELYPKAFKASWLANALPGSTPTFALGLRNPATFLPALYDQQGRGSVGFQEFLGGLDPYDVAWSDYIARIQAAVPDAQIITWCDEDTPLLWPDIIRALAGLPDDQNVVGALDGVGRILTRQGFQELAKYLEAHPPSDPAAWRQTVAAFLDQYAHTDALEVEINLPGWTDDVVEDLTDEYDADVSEIAEMPGVRLLQP